MRRARSKPLSNELDRVDVSARGCARYGKNVCALLAAGSGLVRHRGLLSSAPMFDTTSQWRPHARGPSRKAKQGNEPQLPSAIRSDQLPRKCLCGAETPLPCARCVTHTARSRLRTLVSATRRGPSLQSLYVPSRDSDFEAAVITSQKFRILEIHTELAEVLQAAGFHGVFVVESA
jgi:hypothetical protein